MTVDRLTPTGAGLNSLSGPDYATAVAEEVQGLWDTSVIALTSVSGTNTITASASPVLASGYSVGMKFSFIAAGTNTGAATININSEGAADLVDDDGNALGAGQIVSGRLYLIEYDSSGDFRLHNSADITKVTDYQAFTSSGTWTKPAGTPANALVIVHAWGAGGGGGTGTAGGGGGGGCFVRSEFVASALGSTETVTIGAGGAAGAGGGNSTFGSHVTAYGGGYGAAASGSVGGGGGGGGGFLGAGGAGSAPTAGTGGPLGGAAGGAGGDATSIINGSDGNDGEPFAGAGGAGGGDPNGAANGGDGGNAFWGGAGGGGANGAGGTDGSGGTSVFGGDGGDAGVAGAAPGGGGGGAAAGARGEIRVWTVG